MKIHIVIGVDSPCAIDVKGFRTEAEAKKYADKMNDNPPNGMLWYDIEEVEINEPSVSIMRKQTVTNCHQLR